MKTFFFLGLLFAVLGVVALVVVVDDSAMSFVQGHLGSACDVTASCRSTLRLTGGILAAVFLPMAAMFLYLGAPSPSGERKKKGVKGRAVLVGATDTGVSVQGSPWMDLTLQVETPGMTPYTQSLRAVVPRGYGPGLPPGLSFPVRVDPLDPTKIDIDWAGATAPTG